MLSDDAKAFTKENLDNYLKELSREFRKLNGNRMPAEIILVGGASILINYGFRDATYDCDAIVHASSAMKEAANNVGDRLGLPNGWFNSDFQRTKSYSDKLSQYSKHYRTFFNIVDIRTVFGEYLVAMKLMSGRQYKNDMSDIVGILWEQQQTGQPLSFQDIDRAVCNLYDGWEALPGEARKQIEEILTGNDLENLYNYYRDSEIKTKQNLVEFEEKYPKVLTEKNLEQIIQQLEQETETKKQ